jgi:cytochrome P450
MTTELIDLTDVELFVTQRHYDVFAYLREHEPVFWQQVSANSGFWAITRYDDVVGAYNNHLSFSSEGGAMLGGSFRSEADSAAGRMLVSSDPPRHRMLRQEMHRVFGTEFVTRIGERVSRLIDRALDKAEAEGGCDFSTQVATELPAGAVMEIVGVGHEQAHELIALTRKMIGFRDPFYVDIADGDERLRLAIIQSEMFEYFAELMRDRQRTGPAEHDNLLDVLLNARVNGRSLSEEEIFYNCMNVAVGGNETSSYSACTGILALVESPDQFEMLLGDQSLLGSAINEILRWSTTNAYVQRLAIRDAEIGGKQIARGDSITLWNVSANRDSAQFPDADTFLVSRTPNRHLSYGSGIHRCVGAPVAQAELPILFDGILSRRLRFSVCGPIRRLRSNFIQGITSLPLEVVDGGRR